MKTAVFAVLSAVALTACAPTASAPPPAGFDAGAGSWVGWVRFSGEEFRLYPEQNASRRAFSQDCVSGALPRDLQRQASADLGGMKVVVQGRVAPWSDDLPGDRLEHQGSNITNTCRKDVVILASSIRPN